MSDEKPPEQPAGNGEEGTPPPPPAKPAWEELPVDPKVEDAASDPLIASLRAVHGEAIGPATRRAGELAVEIARAAIREVCASLKSEHGYSLLVDICGVHYPQREGAELEVIYQLLNIEQSRRVRLRVKVAEGEEVPSAVPVWRGADWCERETWDMYGIRFTDHPDMTRILMWEGFNGHPLRKDFPVEGIDTGSAIYPELYEDQAGPVAGTGTGWKAPKPEPPVDESAEPAAPEEGPEGA
jgi:NADH-quinone oxidoreductase subunit C